MATDWPLVAVTALGGLAVSYAAYVAKGAAQLAADVAGRLSPAAAGLGRCFRSAAWLADLRGDGRFFWFGDGGFGRWPGEPLR